MGAGDPYRRRVPNLTVALGTYIVEVAWDGNTSTFTHANADVTTHTFNVRCSRGRDVASQLTGHSEPGRFEAILNNQSGMYNSYNTTGSLYGNLKPGRMVQLRATAPTAGTLWRGYITSIRPGPSVKGVDTVVIQAEGPLGFINQADVSPVIMSNVDSGSVIAKILDQAGWYGSGTMAGSFRDIDTGITTIETFVHGKDKPMAMIRKVEETESGFIRESNNGKIVFESRTRRGQSPYTTSQVFFTDDLLDEQFGLNSLFYKEIEQEEPLAFVFSELVTTIQQYTTGATGTLWKMGTGDVGANALVPMNGGTRTFGASYPNPTATANAIGVFSWTAPTATVDYNFFSDPAGTGTNMNAEVVMSTVDNVNELELTFTNTANRLAYVTFMQARGVPLLKDDPVIIPKRTASSTASYGKRTAPVHGGYVPNVEEAVGWSDWNAAVYSDPTPRFSITVPANRSDAHLIHAILRDVSDRITLSSVGSARLGVSGDFFIEKVEHEIDADRTHTVKYYLSEAEQFSDMWVLNVAALGTTTRLHY